MARSKKQDNEMLPTRKTLYDNHLYAEEPGTAIRTNVGIAARLLGTCCLGGTSATTKSPIGVKPNVTGTWEDCPAFDLDPLASRQASAVVGSTWPRKASDDARYLATSPQQVPLGEGEQAQAATAPSSPDRTSFPARTSFPGQGPASAPHTTTRPAHLQIQSPNGAGTPAPTPGIPDGGYAPTQDSAAEMMYSDTDSLGPPLDSPLQPQPRERMSMQHRVALRLLERKGVFGEGGAVAGSGRGNGSPTSATSAGSSTGTGTDSPRSPQQQGQQQVSQAGSFVTAVSTSEPLQTSSGPVVLLSPTSAYNSSAYQTPNGSMPLGVPYESAVEMDERMCLHDDDGIAGMVGPGHRSSAPGLPGRQAWGWPDVTSGGSGTPDTPGGGSDLDGGALRMRGSDFGGVVGGVVPGHVYARAHQVRAGSGLGGGIQDPGGSGLGGGNRLHRGNSGGVGLDDPGLESEPTWSAAGGRVELSQEEKEWLFGQPGGVGGLASVMPLGEGGEGLVDLVRLALPGRTLHLARKATRTFLPAYALTAAGGGQGGAAALALGVIARAHSVSYRFPFEVFDREVRAMKAVKDSGFVIRFQAAAYDHDHGQGFIVMEAAPYGTLEDLHAALCRSQLQPVQRQRPALLQRAIAKLQFMNAKSSAPPSLLPGDTSPLGGTGGSGATSGLTSPANSPGAAGDRPSYARATPKGIGSCGGAALELAEAEAANGGGGAGGEGGLGDRLSCCSTTPAAVSSPYSPADRTSNARTSAQGSMCALGSSLMSTRALRYYGACMLQALVALHEAGYVYRDLKLSNVLVCDGGRVRLTDFGAAASSLPDQPGRFSGAAGTRAYLAPEVLPWLEGGAGAGGLGSGGGGGGGGGKGSSKRGDKGAEPYTVTVDSWSWGLVMVELATGWSLKELTTRIIRRVCHPKSPQAPDLPPDCGLPPALRQLLLDHVLVRDPRDRWPAARIRSHRFFEGLDWDGLAEAEGPHAHLFSRGRLLNTVVRLDGDPGEVAEAMRTAAEKAGSGGRAAAAAAAAAATVAAASGGSISEVQVTGSSVSGTPTPTYGRISPVDKSCNPLSPAYAPQPPAAQPPAFPRATAGSGRQAFVLGVSVPNSPLLSPATPGGVTVQGCSPASSAAGPTPGGGGGQAPHRLSSTGFGAPVGGVARTGGARVSYSGGGLLIAPVVVGAAASPAVGGTPVGSAGPSPAAGVMPVGRRLVTMGSVGSRRPTAAGSGLGA